MTQLDVAVVTLEKKYSTDEDATAAIKNMKAACSKHAADAARRETSVNFTVATGIISGDMSQEPAYGSARPAPTRRCRLARPLLPG